MKQLLMILCCLSVAASGQVPKLQWAKLDTVYASGESGSPYFTHALVVSSDGNAIAAGCFSATVDFDPGPGTYTLSSTKAEGIFISCLDPAGNFRWARAITGKYKLWIRNMVRDPGDNLYITGEFYDTLDFDPGPGVYNAVSTGSGSEFILKLDRDGNFRWVKCLAPATGTVRTGRLAADNSGVYIIGRQGAGVSGTPGVADFDPGPGVFTLADTGGNDFILKLDPAGSFSWAKQWNRLLDFVPPCITLDSHGDVYIAGAFSPGKRLDLEPGPGIVTDTAWGSFITRLDPAGNFVWSARTRGRYIECLDMATDSAGNIYVGGYYQEAVDFDPGPATFTQTSELGTMDGYITKVDPAGHFVWVKTFGSGYVDMVTNLSTRTKGSIYVAGDFAYPPLTAAVDFDPGPLVHKLDSKSGPDFIIQLDPDGNYLSGGNMFVGDSYYKSMAADDAGNIYCAGYFSIYPGDFDPDTSTYTILTTAPCYYMLKLGGCALHPYITRTDSSFIAASPGATFQWLECPGYKPVPGATGAEFKHHGSGSYVVVSRFGSCVDTSVCMDALSIGDPQQAQFGLYPVPAASVVHIGLPAPEQGLSLRMENSSGQLVLEKQGLSGSRFTVDVSGLVPGIYFVRLCNAHKSWQVQKLLKD